MIVCMCEFYERNLLKGFKKGVTDINSKMIE